MKKKLAMLLALAMMFTLVACGQEAAAPAEDANAEGGVTELTMWCIATESDSNRHSYEAAIEELATTMPDVKLTWEATENQAYKTKIKAAAQADEMPDIFFTWSCAFLKDFVDAGRVYCLDTVYQDYKTELTSNMLNNVTFDGSIYGVPLTMNIVGLFANMDLLKEVGYDEVPGTYEEFIACCDALKAKDITPFGCSGGETWCVTEYLESVIEKYCGAATLDALFAGTDSWNNEDVAAAVDIFQGMIDDGYFKDFATVSAMTNDEVKADFIAGKYAFYMNGTWNCADFASHPELNVQVAEFPVIDADKSQLGQLIGGPSDTLAVAASSANAEVAAKYCMELGKAICHYGYLDGCGLPAWTPFYDVSSINPLTQAVSQIVANSNQMVLFGDTAMSADTANIYLDYVAQVYGGQVDGAGFIAGLANDIG